MRESKGWMGGLREVGDKVLKEWWNMAGQIEEIVIWPSFLKVDHYRTTMSSLASKTTLWPLITCLYLFA